MSLNASSLCLCLSVRSTPLRLASLPDSRRRARGRQRYAQHWRLYPADPHGDLCGMAAVCV
jgi:hypothetical protein